MRLLDKEEKNMPIAEKVNGEITYNSDKERSKFSALLNLAGKKNTQMTMEELADLLITHEGFKFELKIYKDDLPNE